MSTIYTTYKCIFATFVSILSNFRTIFDIPKNRFSYYSIGVGFFEALYPMLCYVISMCEINFTCKLYFIIFSMLGFIAWCYQITLFKAKENFNRMC